MEDKSLDLLTKMYSEFSKRFDDIDQRLNGFNGRLYGVDGRLDGIDGRLDGINGEVRGLKNDIIRIENKLDSHSKSLFDGYHQTYEKVCTVEANMDKLSSKVDKQDVEIKVVKGRK